MSLQVCLLGFGEVGQALAVDLGARRVEPRSVGRSVPSPTARRAAIARRICGRHERRRCGIDADLVISAVTAAQDVAAARSVVPHLKRNAYFLDVNSVSPA